MTTTSEQQQKPSAATNSQATGGKDETGGGAKGGKTESAANDADKHKRFENEGVVFKAKLIGSELVMEPRGDKMCQNSIQRLKAIIKGTNSHKRKIVLKISYDGVKVYDEKTNEILHHHEVSQISYIASDDTDNRTFGYVSDVPNKAHQFICFKTSGPAMTVMSVISALFEAVLERKNQAEKEKEEQREKGSDELKKQNSSVKAQDSIDLIGDSGIMDVDASLSESIDIKNHLVQSLSGSAHVSNNVSSPANSFGSVSNNNNNNSNNLRSKQSASTADLIFEDLFAGLSDPIIVDKNDSLISYKQPIDNNPAGSINPPQQQQQQQQQQQEHHQQLSSQAPAFTMPVRIGVNSARPIPKRQNPPPVLPPPPSSLPRPGAAMMHSAQAHNRSLVYNHSSVSLSDAALTRQSSFTTSSAANTPQHATTPTNAHDSYVDRYAVFNDIDSLPSIFESTSLGSVNNLSGSMSAVGAPKPASMGPVHPIIDPIFGSSNASSSAPMADHYSGHQKPVSFQAAAANSAFSQSFNQNFSSAAAAATHQQLQMQHQFQQNPQHSIGGFGGSATGLSGAKSFIPSQNVPIIQSSTPASTTVSSPTSDASMFRQTNPFDDDFFA